MEVSISTEIELKLAARPADLPELKRALVALAPASVSAQERLVSTYYDTPELTLQRSGLTLRVREQAGRFMQTVKAEDAGRAGLHSRGEWEDWLAENQPQPDAPQSGPHLPPEIGADLRALFATDVTRTVVEMEPRTDTRIEAAIDEGEVRVTGDHAVEPISEIELELKNGETAALYDIALRLLDVAPVRIQTRSKSERGYSLASGKEPAAPVHAEPLSLERDMPVEIALQKIGRSCLTQLVGNEAAVLAGNSEGVHQMRVAARRIRSVVSSLKEMLPVEDRHWIAEEVGWIAGTLGPARNLDVFADELFPDARAGMPDESGWEDLATMFDRLRREAYSRVREAIRSERYAALTLRLSQWCETCSWRANQTPEQAAQGSAPIGEVAAQVLDRRRHKVRRRSKQFANRTPPERHKLRIAVKKLRYTTELFGSLFDKNELQNFLSRLRKLQNGLGYSNDVRVAHEFVIDLFAATEPRSPAAHAWVATLGWHDHALSRGERRLCKHVRRLRDAPPFWHG
jgi:inorganic triphosphatase YgiF